MPTLDDRLARYATALDGDTAADLARRVSGAGTVGVAPRPRRRSTRRAVLPLAAGFVAIAGIAVAVAVRSDGASTRVSVAPSGAPVSAPPVTAGASSSTIAPLPRDDSAMVPAPPSRDVPADGDEYGARPWDPVPLAVGTTAWYQTGTGVPDDVARHRAVGPPATADFMSRFFTCTSWEGAANEPSSLTAALPVCDGLSGNATLDEFGQTLSIGTALGSAATAEAMARMLAEGSLWGYDTFAAGEQPDPDMVALDVGTGYRYRNGDKAYLVWQQRPEAIVWLFADGVGDDDLTTIANGVVPAGLPRELAVPIALGPFDAITRSGISIGWLDGVACAGYDMWARCTPLDQGPVLIAETATSGPPLVAAIVPAGSGVMPRPVLASGAEPAPPIRSFVGLGIEVYSYSTPDDVVVYVDLVAADGTTLQRIELGNAAILDGYADHTVASGSRPGSAWLMTLQFPTPGPEAGATKAYTGNVEGALPACVILIEIASGDEAPLCLPANAPATGIGTHADRHGTLDLAEVAADVTQLWCGSEEVPIVQVTEFDNRRFAVLSCAEPTSAPTSTG